MIFLGDNYRISLVAPHHPHLDLGIFMGVFLDVFGDDFGLASALASQVSPSIQLGF